MKVLDYNDMPQYKALSHIDETNSEKRFLYVFKECGNIKVNEVGNPEAPLDMGLGIFYTVETALLFAEHYCAVLSEVNDTGDYSDKYYCSLEACGDNKEESCSVELTPSECEFEEGIHIEAEELGEDEEVLIYLSVVELEDKLEESKEKNSELLNIIDSMNTVIQSME